MKDRRIRAATLTGSEGAGSAVAATCGSEIKPTVLELGGSDAFIVMPSCDLDDAVEKAVTGRILNNGQSCIAAKRFIIHDDIHDEFRDRMVERFESLKVGDPKGGETDVGPLALAQIRDELDKQVRDSVKAGARLLTGGKKTGDKGYYYQPGILTDIPVDAPAYSDELFGPVASLYNVDGLESASSSGGLVNLNGGFHSYLGADMRDHVEYLSGAIDDVGVFSGVLTASAVSTLFTAGPGFNLSYDHDDYSAAEHLVAFYPMNSMNGTTLVDASGNGHDGVIEGPVWAGDLVPEPQWLMVSGGTGWLESGAAEELDIIVITTGLTTDAVYNAAVLVLTAAEAVTIPVYLLVNEALGVSDPQLIVAYRLYPAYPNPFNPVTTIQYSIPAAVDVRLSIYNMLGEEVEILAAGKHQPGNYTVSWNGSRFSSGMYFYRLYTSEFSTVRKLLLLK